MKASRPCVISETGRRDSNQDRACAKSLSIGAVPSLLLAVADGMGGMDAGDQAAEMAIATACEYAESVLPTTENSPAALGSALEHMFQTANRRVWEFGRERGVAGKVGTTLVCCLITGTRYLVAHVGDSRCLYINDHEVRQLTVDHTRVQDMVRRGVMTAEAARRSPFRNELTNSLGEPEPVSVDLVPARDKVGVLDEPCVLLLSTDGLHASLFDHDYLSHLRGTWTSAEACSALVKLASARGSTDNITVAAVEIGRLRRRPPLPRAVPDKPKGPVTVKLRRPPVRPHRRRRLPLWVASAAALAALSASALWWGPLVAPDMTARASAAWSWVASTRLGSLIASERAAQRAGSGVEQDTGAGGHAAPNAGTDREPARSGEAFAQPDALQTASPPTAGESAAPGAATAPTDGAQDSSAVAPHGSAGRGDAVTLPQDGTTGAVGVLQLRLEAQWTQHGKDILFSWQTVPPQAALDDVTYQVELSDDESFKRNISAPPELRTLLNSVPWPPDRDLDRLFARVIALHTEKEITVSNVIRIPRSGGIPRGGRDAPRKRSRDPERTLFLVLAPCDERGSPATPAPVWTRLDDSVCAFVRTTGALSRGMASEQPSGGAQAIPCVLPASIPLM